jgi:hypothetical protein
MASTPKIFTLSLFIVALFLSLPSLSGVSIAAQQSMGSSKTIKGKIARIEGDNYFVKKREDGQEVRLHVDKTTQMNAVGIIPGANILAKVDDENHVISILTDQSAETIQQEQGK